MTWPNRLLDLFFPPPTEEQKEERAWRAFGLDLHGGRDWALDLYPELPPAVAMRRYRRRYFGLEDE